jgi:II/X family phage/plasmid replication protein
MTILDDSKVEERLRAEFSTVTKGGRVSYTVPNNVMRTYLLIREQGFQVAKRLTSDRTFREHIEKLKIIGISRAALQTFGTPNVIPLVRFVEVEFGEQVPKWANVA